MTSQENPGQRTVVVGVGNEFRRDDGAGPEVIARLRALQPGDASLSGVTLALSDGEPGRMIDLWEGARLAVVVDAVRDPRLPAGHRYQFAVDSLAGVADSVVDGAASSHGIGLGDTVELARVLGRLPARLTVLAVVGRDFGFGTVLTAEVATAVGELVEQVREIVRR
jgi:hydrogenase maturation protease